MKNFFLKYCVIALVYINATIVFAQNTIQIDSLITIVNEQVKDEEYIAAEKLLDSLKTVPEYKIDTIKLKVDYAYAIFYKTQNKDELALEILLDGLSKIKENNPSKYLAEYAYEIGSGFSKLDNYYKAIKYFRIVLSYGIKFNDSLEVSKGSLGVGNQHFKLYRKTLYTEDSLTIKMHKDSLNYYWNITKNHFPKSNENKTVLGYLYTAKIAFNFYEEKLEIAEYFGKKASEIWLKIGDSILMQNTLNILGAVNWKKQDYNKAIEYYSQGLKLVENSKNYSSREATRSIISNLSQSYFYLKNYKKAYELRTESLILMDELLKETDRKEYLEIEAKYNFYEKEKLAEIEKNKRKNVEVWLYVFSISTGVLMLFLWLVYRSNKYKRQKQELEFQKENLLQERALEKVQNEAQIKILNAAIDGKEAERRHIAEILHDSVSTLLSSAGLHLQAAKIELKENAPEEIAKSQAIVREAGEKIRDLSHKLISSVLLKFGLAYAMDDLCQKYSNSKLTFESDSNAVERFSSEFEIKIHSIIEELINNILKHSNASNANILLKQFEGQLQIRIFDDGDGFDVETIRINDTGGLGLTQIEARIKMMKGIFDIKSSKETGTRIFIQVPIPDLD